MPTEKTRFTLTVTDDMVKRAEALKKDKYYGKTDAEVYRQLIQTGMDTLEKQKKVEIPT